MGTDSCSHTALAGEAWMRNDLLRDLLHTAPLVRKGSGLAPTRSAPINILRTSLNANAQLWPHYGWSALGRDVDNGDRIETITRSTNITLVEALICKESCIAD